MWSKIKMLFLSKLFFKHLGLLILVHLLVFYFTLIYLEYATKHGEKIAVPNVVGYPVEEAKQALSEANLRFEILDSIYCPCLPPGIVLEQMIDPTLEKVEPVCDCNEKDIKLDPSLKRIVLPSEVYVKSGRIVQLRLSKNSEFVEVPDLVNKQYEFARDILKRRGLKSTIKYTTDEQRSGSVIDQLNNENGNPILPGVKVPVGSTIKLLVGRYIRNEKVDTPNLVGKYLDEAKYVLKRNGFNNFYINCIGCQTSRDSTTNVITKQYPEYYVGSKVNKGASFTLTIGPVISEESEIE